MGGDRTDFFVSHAGADRAWAEWVAWQLAEAGYTVELDVWDWAAGRNFMTAISDALERCDRVVALFSAAYFDRSRYTTGEWSAAVVHVPGVEGGRLVPVRVEEVPAAQVPAVLWPLVCRDVFGVAEGQARRVLLEAVAGPRRPDRRPVFPGPGTPGGPGGAGPRLPGTVPRVWSIPARNPGFTGRDALLVAVRERLRGRRPDGAERVEFPADADPLRCQRSRGPRPPHLRPHHGGQLLTAAACMPSVTWSATCGPPGRTGICWTRCGGA